MRSGIIECMSTLAERIDDTSPDDRALTLVRRAGTVFAATSVSLVALEGIEAAGLLSNTTQGGISFAVTVLAAVVAIGSGVRLRTSARLHWGLYILVATGALYMLISWTEDLPFLDEVPIFGQDDKTGRKMAKIALLAMWFTSPPFLAWKMIAAHRRLTDSLADRINQRTRSLSDANSRLRSEIRDHVSTSNELREAQRRLASLVEERSQRLADAQEELVRHERLKALGTMASGIAHELNNALTPARAFVELLLRDDNLTSDQKSWLTYIDKSTADAASIVQSLQQFHGEGASPSSRSNLDPAALVREVVSLTRPVWKGAAEAEGKQIRLDTFLEEDLTVLANARELRQVLINLILNSIEALADQGTITLKLKRINDTVEFRVADSGHGMNELQIKRCMEPFYTTKAGGTGLGLSVCRGIVDHYGSELRVESPADGGTSIAFQLPLVRSKVTQEQRPSRDSRISLKVLYVEDNRQVRQASSDVCWRHWAWKSLPRIAANNRSSSRKSKDDFDVVIVDMGMPEMKRRRNDRRIATPWYSLPNHRAFRLVHAIRDRPLRAAITAGLYPHQTSADRGCCRNTQEGNADARTRSAPVE